MNTFVCKSGKKTGENNDPATTYIALVWLQHNQIIFVELLSMSDACDMCAPDSMSNDIDTTVDARRHSVHRLF